MREEYDFSQSVPNPYIGKLEESAITIRLEGQVAEYFNSLAAESGIPLQNVIDLYLKNCAQTQRKISLNWTEAT